MGLEMQKPDCCTLLARLTKCNPLRLVRGMGQYNGFLTVWVLKVVAEGSLYAKGAAAAKNEVAKWGKHHCIVLTRASFALL